VRADAFYSSHNNRIDQCTYGVYVTIVQPRQDKNPLFEQ